MDMEDCILLPTKSQHLDNLQEHPWQQQFSSAVDAATKLSPDNLQLHQYNPLVYNFEDWSILNDFEFGFMPSSSPSLSSLLESELESPISGSSFTSAEDLFDDTGIDPNDLSRYLYNKPTAAYRASLLDSPNLQPLEDSQLESSQPSIGLLSPREIQELYAIAMPATAQSPHSSDSTSSPEPELEIEAQTRKRPQKQQPAKSKAKPLSPKHQTAHNMIEKRYRNNLNNKIAALRDSVPSLRTATKKYDDRDSAESDLDGQNQPRKLNKSTVLSKAIEYISHLEERAGSLSKENTTLQLRVASLEGLILQREKRRP